MARDDPEKATSSTAECMRKSSERTKSDDNDDLQLVRHATWDGDQDPANPQNWPPTKKTSVVFMVSFLASISPLASTMTAPALPAIAHDLNISSTPELQFTLSIFVLGYAIGPLCLAPLSEVYGRVWVAQLSNLWFLLFNTVCGFATSTPQLLAFRFLAGLGSSTTASVGAGVLGDCYHPGNMGSAAALYSVLPVLSPVIGPIVGGFVTQHTTWRWIFWAISIWDAVIQVAAFFVLHETHKPIVLGRRLKHLYEARGQKVDIPQDRPSVYEVLKGSITRPLYLLCTQALVQALALYMGFLSGVSYIVDTTFPTLWRKRYGQSTSIGSLHYIVLGVGAIVGAQICSYANDRIYKALSARNGGKGSPDFRLPTMLLGAVLAPIGLFWYGWSAEARLHWTMPDIGGAIYYAGFMMGLINVHMYVIDIHGSNSASAMAAVSFVQSLFGALFPLFGANLYTAIGYGWGNSVMGFISIGLGIPALALLWRFGARMRKEHK
ncbi:polyamine transporter 3 [Penicillium verhagenii]|uniref:polyamine transporter 3 n=1 Tax=Penicillium verhagenii TaxID=1562060 RepID=UPI0025453117|nr:polyamine transporter 3 [Penicillium verhagenii]KAJ5936719.1 polyamine transporter 3 [Penicillium verhagenii]